MLCFCCFKRIICVRVAAIVLMTASRADADSVAVQTVLVAVCSQQLDSQILYVLVGALITPDSSVVALATRHRIRAR